MKIDADEKELLQSVERGEWKSAGGGKRERTRYSRYAKATFKKDRRLNIRLSSKDLEAIQKRALAEGLPYQTLIASLLHKYATGRLKEISISALTRVQDSPATIVPESSSVPLPVRNRSMSQRTGGHAAHDAFSPQCRLLLRRRVRSRCDACFTRFPQMAMLHHRRAWPRVRSTKRSVQGERLHAFTCVQSSPQIKSAMALAIGSSRVSGERQRLSSRHVNCDCARRWPRSRATI